ncbi:LysR family transcriptional regulator [Pseudochrobactrum kiredjianiae]|uniref:LysR family transcriptional regulator n=1 Tax=Pseudochrobactrum kiredjianiae TaxID=386305 RepID=A0ABW3V132_9HYPH|nr:LysR family transcriptional regulator [Pseudochrobactrum kiredjianiae]MDM7853254.1 LysR family transcriptional regulator [Pseudochrobactrum kiredjianiae]
MNFRQLSAFQAVMQTGTVTAASALLRISQPSVSAHIANLEHNLKLQLFQRVGGRLLPTTEAVLFHQEVTQLMQGMGRLKNFASSINNLQTGELNIGSFPALASIVMPTFIGSFLKKLPEIKLSLISEGSFPLAELVAHRQIDIGFIQMPVDDPAIICKPFFETAFICAVSPQHPFANKISISPQDLNQQSIIRLMRNTELWRNIEKTFQNNNINAIFRYETDLADLACSFAEQELGIAIVDPYSALRWNKQLKLIPFDVYIPANIYLIYSRFLTHSLLQKSFENELQNHLKSDFLFTPTPNK